MTGLPAGIGAPMFGSVESRLSAAIFGIGAVRGIDFGAGFSAAYMRGSEHNDPYYMDNGCVKTRTNNHGGGRRHRHHTRNDDGLCFGLSV